MVERKNKYSIDKIVLLRHTNVFGNTYFVNYIEWQGEARERFFLEYPAALEYLNKNPQLMMVTNKLYHQFIKNTFFGDKIRIDVTTKEIRQYSFIIVFRYYDKDGDLIGDGWQKICFIDRNSNQPCHVPKLFCELAAAVKED